MLRTWRFLYIFTWKCAFRHSGVQFLMSPLSTYLRTRRFNRPTFGLTRHTNLWKNTAFRDFSNIWRGRIFFLLTFWLLLLLSTDLTTLLLLFNSPYCRKFLFKLPSIIQMGWNHQLGLYCVTVHLFVIYIHVHVEIGFNNLQLITCNCDYYLCHPRITCDTTYTWIVCVEARVRWYLSLLINPKMPRYVWNRMAHRYVISH